MYVGIDSSLLYIDQNGSFMFYKEIYRIMDSSFHSFRVIEYPYVKTDHYTVSMPFISTKIGSARTKIIVVGNNHGD